MVIVIDWIAVIITTFLAIVESSFFQKDKKAFLYLIFYLLFCFPILLDYLIGFPDYSQTYWYGFTASSQDPNTRIVYSLFCIFFSACYFCLQKVFKNYKKRDILQDKKSANFKKISNWLCLFLESVSLIIVLLFVENKNIIFNFGWRYSVENSATSINYTGYGAAERFTYIGIVCAGILLFSDSNFLMKVYSIPSIYFNVCIEGKRSIILFAFFVFFIAFLFREKIKFRRKQVTFVLLGSAIVLLCFVIVSYIKFRSPNSFASFYRSARIDYFRDQTLRFVIYSLLNTKEISILSYPFESYISQIGYLFPLTLFPIQKTGFETYLTSALRFTPISELNNTRSTTSLIDEITSNFGFFGLFLSPFIIFGMGVWTQTRPYSEKIIYYSLWMLLFMYSLSYICWFIEFAIVISILNLFFYKLSNQKSTIVISHIGDFSR